MKNTSCSLFHFMTLWRERPDETFRWVKHVIKTISSTQIFSLDVRTSLQRNVVSHPSTCHFCPVLHIIFFLQKHLQLCISRGRHGYRHVRTHRISKNDTILDFHPWLWPCCPPKISKNANSRKLRKNEKKRVLRFVFAPKACFGSKGASERDYQDLRRRRCKPKFRESSTLEYSAVSQLVKSLLVSFMVAIASH